MRMLFIDALRPFLVDVGDVAEVKITDIINKGALGDLTEKYLPFPVLPSFVDPPARSFWTDRRPYGRQADVLDSLDVFRNKKRW